ncbi:MAG: Lon protease family protein [Desulforhopalus sp.]
MTVGKLTPDKAYTRCNLDTFFFETTKEITEFSEFAGQDRALEAIAFGIGIRHKGFNLFANGPQGSRRHEITQKTISEKAQTEPPPQDWCYVNNFSKPHNPKSFSFPSGECSVFKHELSDLIDILKTTIPSVIEDEVFKEKINTIDEELRRKIAKRLHTIEEKANTESIALIKGEQGILFTPMDESRTPIDQNVFQRLPLEKRKRIENLMGKYQHELQGVMNQIADLKREAEESRKKLKHQTVGQAVASLSNTLKRKYEKRPSLKQFIQELEDDIINNAEDFLSHLEGDQGNLARIFKSHSPSFEKYAVNILVGDTKSTGAPVIYEDLPTYQNLHGRIEHISQMGVLSTNFTLIKPGSLHRANGGYIIIDASRLLMQPYAYEGLKRTLRSGHIRIEPIERLLGIMSTVTLEPEPIPLDTKVILIGDTLLYYLLKHYDPEFQSFFKVQVDFEHQMDRTQDNIRRYASLLALISERENILPIHKSGVARLIEYSSRKAADCTKLSLELEVLGDVVKEADYIARNFGKCIVDSSDIESALESRTRRGSRIKDRMFESIQQGLKHISTSGTCVGQVNGLSVIAIDDEAFGMPTRLTALARPGKSGVIDIEKEVNLGGPIHSKGVLILESFLSSRYVRDMPLSLRASIVFEQSYGDVEGDSASCAELCALLSALADVPVHQSIAITGSISQLGEIQAIGGVNEKIEAFFDLCVSRELTGQQGVIIPSSNTRHLMLKKEVVEAITSNQFCVHTVDNIDEAITLLTSLPAGKRDDDGEFPENSINAMVERTLRSYALRLQLFEKIEYKIDSSGDSVVSDDN